MLIHRFKVEILKWLLRLWPSRACGLWRRSRSCGRQTPGRLHLETGPSIPVSLFNIKRIIDPLFGNQGITNQFHWAWAGILSGDSSTNWKNRFSRIPASFTRSCARQSVTDIIQPFQLLVHNLVSLECFNFSWLSIRPVRNCDWTRRPIELLD